MKLAEALNLRADLRKRISQLSSRLNNNAKIQEGEHTAEDPVELMKELDDCIAQFSELVARINKTNSETVSDGESITEMLARKDALSIKLAAYRNFLTSASSIVNRYSNTEIKILPSVDVKSLQKKVDKMSKEYRELDVKLQGLNWTADLL